MYQFFNHVRTKANFSGQAKRYCGSQRKPTHYDILGITKDATKKDIRSAFIKLSKKIHPDKSNETSTKSHNDFIKISEAYNVLSKDYSRQQYDLHLKYYSYESSPNSYNHYYNSNSNSRTNDGYNTYRSNAYYRDFSFYQDINNIRSRRRSGTYNETANKNLKSQAVIFCIVLSIIGSILQFAAITRSPVFNREDLVKRSEMYYENYHNVRRQAIPKEDAEQMFEKLKKEDIDELKW
ncbi:dnaJ homolog subfamily C member 4-like [Microplitis mediator]|uniref:dnaJ homolog subfamily C member 4-like n=1 Tax=Microplitis mediator TaxID=375433 RepID=UPI0025543B0C|nr:dnaJ homolog subfamily C member 4-like [Microplitis mediator]